MGMNIKVASASDPKPASYKFFKGNWSGMCAHFYRNMHEQAVGGACVMHPGKNCASTGTVDCFGTGTPCQGWSRLRGKSKGVTAPSDHDGWSVTFKDTFEFIDGREVLGGIAEQVVGFADTDRHSDPAALQGEPSPYRLFLKMLEVRGFKHTTFRLNMKHWLRYPGRDRLYIVYVSDTLGGVEAIKWMEGAMQDLFRVRWIRYARISYVGGAGHLVLSGSVLPEMISPN
jgi:hypothetical protein